MSIIRLPDVTADHTRHMLIFDPSSTRLGYARWRNGWLDDGGFFSPEKGAKCSYKRILGLGVHAEEMAKENPTATVVIEAPDGKVHGAIAARSRGQGQSIYGAAFGAILARVAGVAETIILITPNEWTRGTKKESRAKVVHLRLPTIDFSKDRGHDMADAIGLGIFLMERTQRSMK